MIFEIYDSSRSDLWSGKVNISPVFRVHRNMLRHERPPPSMLQLCVYIIGIAAIGEVAGVGLLPVST